MRRRALLSAELHLSELEAEPDPGAAARMSAFDGLPPGLRRQVDECPFDFPALQIAKAVERDGPVGTATKISRSIVINRQDYARERASALSWAVCTFTLRGRRRAG